MVDCLTRRIRSHQSKSYHPPYIGPAHRIPRRPRSAITEPPSSCPKSPLPGRAFGMQQMQARYAASRVKCTDPCLDSHTHKSHASAGGWRQTRISHRVGKTPAFVATGPPPRPREDIRERRYHRLICSCVLVFPPQQASLV